MHQLVSAGEAAPDLGFMARTNSRIMKLADRVAQTPAYTFELRSLARLGRRRLHQWEPSSFVDAAWLIFPCASDKDRKENQQ